METNSVCIVGCCRNIEPYLKNVLENLDKISSWWKDYKIVIFENDSTDNTFNIISKWANTKNDKCELIKEYNLDKQFPERSVRLAYIRNILLDKVPKNFDYMLMVDMDDVFANEVKKESFESCFLLKDWSVVTANSKYYYDIWALRIPNIIEFDCWHKYYELSKIYKMSYKNLIRKINPDKVALWNAIEKFKDIMRKAKNPIEVNSAFNCAILCKISSIKPCCRFVGFVDNKIICEHVPFQNCIRRHGGKIIFNPNFTF